MVDGKLVATGKVGAEVVDRGGRASWPASARSTRWPRSRPRSASWSQVVRIVKVVGFVASAPGFTGQPQVVNGASELLGEVFGDAGKHARSAVGVAVLPLDAPVEVELIAEVR